MFGSKAEKNNINWAKKNTDLPIAEMKTFFTKPLFIIVPWMRKSRHFVDTLIHQAIYGSFNPEATALYRVKYRQHNERVRAVIPAEKLLVFNVKKG